MANIPFLNNAYFSAKVGIGTDSPDAKLSISDILGISGTGNNTYGQVDLVNTQTGASGDEIGPFITFRGKRGGIDSVVAAYGAIGGVNTGTTGNSTGAITFLTKNVMGAAEDLVEQMRISTGGNVGIGTDSPGAKLDVSGDVLIDSGEYISWGTVGSTSIEGSTASNKLQFRTSSTDRMIINDTGVGIGTTSPAADFVVSHEGTSGIEIEANFQMGVNNILSFDRTAGALAYETMRLEAGDFWFLVLGVERMRIDSAGNVGIGTNSPSEKLSIETNAYNNAPEYIEFTDAGSGSSWVNGQDYGGIQWFMGDGTGIGAHTVAQIKAQNEKTGAAGSGALVFSTAPYNTVMSERMRITSAGNVEIGTSTVATANAAADDLWLRSTGSNGITISSGNAQTGTIFFGDVANAAAAGFRYNHNTGDMAISAEDNITFACDNVGIGTTSPSTTLQLSRANTEVLANNPAWPKGILEITDTSAYNAGTGATIVFRKKRDSPGNQVTVGAIAGEGIGGNSQLSFWTGDSAYMGTAPKMVIKNTGKAGIGTITPQSKLQVAGGIQMADDTDTASATKVGTMRYRTGTEYVEVTGTELVTNGDFATDSSWTKETGWSIGSGVASYNGSSANNALYENLSLTTGTIYRLSFSIVNYVSGILVGALSGGSLSGNTPNITADGDYVFNLTATGVLCIFRSTSSFNGSIDNVSVIEVTEENASYADMCMQTEASTYEWVNIVRNTY